MILGVLCGQILQRPVSPWKRVGMLLGVAVLCYVLGLAAGSLCGPDREADLDAVVGVVQRRVRHRHAGAVLCAV